MSDRLLKATDNFTFSQRYGYEPLPKPMQLEELSDDLRREIWNITRSNLLKNRKSSAYSYYFPNDFERFIERILGRILQKPEDEISPDYNEVLSHFKKIILQGRFDHLLSLIELVVKDDSDNYRFARKIAELFDSHAAAYWLDFNSETVSIFPTQ